MPANSLRRQWKRWELELFFQPGRWADESELVRIRDGIRGVLSASGYAELEYGILRGSRELLTDCVVGIVREGSTSMPVATSVLPILRLGGMGGAEERILHFGLATVHPKYRQLGFSRILYNHATFLAWSRMGMRTLWFSSVSQVPAVVGMIARSFEDVYPNPLLPERPPTPRHLAIASSLVREHRDRFGVGPEAEFDPERFIIRNSYTGGSDPLKKTLLESALHSSDEVNQFCARHLDYQRGDDFVQIGKITPLVFCRAFARHCARGFFTITQPQTERMAMRHEHSSLP